MNLAFASFTPLEKQDTIYDTFARPTQARLWNGGAIVALTQFNYHRYQGQPLPGSVLSL